MPYKKIYRFSRFMFETTKQSHLLLEDAQSQLNTYHYKSRPTFIQSNVIQNCFDLMIVIPVYNSENYLAECLDSIFAQDTQYSFCVVAVNDGSTDCSSDILEQYAFHDNLTIIHQENRGHSGARNRALELIKAQYVMFVDSDDILPVNAVESLMNPAIRHHADLVSGGYTRFKNTQIIETVQYNTHVSKVPSHSIPGYTCMKVIRSELLRNFCFPEGFWFEDTVLSRLLFPLCDTAYTVPEIVYNYRIHQESISSSHHNNPKGIDTFWLTKYCLEEAAIRGYAMDECQYMKYLQQSRVNYLRTQYLPKEIQESIFVLTRKLLADYFPEQSAPKERKFKMLHCAFQANSFQAYLFVLQRWDII